MPTLPSLAAAPAEPITDIDTTAADMLAALDEDLNAAGTFLVIADSRTPSAPGSSATS
jgi:hypothetical protein